MSFWVYENWTHKKAIIHTADCCYCQNGRGVHAGSSTRNGEWHGPFKNRDTAFDKAKRTGRDEIRSCKSCGA